MGSPTHIFTGGIMRMTRRLAALALWAGSIGLVVLVAAPASADVNCADLKTRDAAQAYFDGRAADLDRLDADGDGRACEGNGGTRTSTWLLIAFGALLAGGVVRYTRLEPSTRSQQTEEAEVPPVAEPTTVGAPLLVEQAAAGVVSSATRRHTVFASATTGSLGELARALRMVPYAERMALLEAHASEHGSPPREVLDHLVEHTSDLELQGWALAGYDPPWTVRVMRCSCVDGMRNFRLKAAPDGSHFWACASCHTPLPSRS